MQLSVAVRNARLDQIEATIGPGAIFRFRSGAAPANTAAADAGTVISTINLPADYMQAASGGSKAMSGTWQDTSADAAGIIGHFRIYASDGVTCHIQGPVTATGGGGDITVDNTNVAANQQISITSFTVTDGNP
jgi:hypothetical protein